MPEVFISYDRESRPLVTTLVDDIQALGHSVWYDEELSGGQAWWDQILGHIRACNVFAFALTPNALDSVACVREYKYAHALGKPIVPILITDGVSTSLLPHALSKIHFVDYRNPSEKTSALDVGRALNSASVAVALPDPLPTPPAVPVSYLGSLAERVAAESLSYAEQTALVVDIKDSLRDSTTADDARQLLLKLKRRQDLLAKTEREINGLLRVKATAEPRQPTTEGQKNQTPSPTEELLLRMLRRSSRTRTVGWFLVAAVLVLSIPVAYLSWWIFAQMLWGWQVDTWWQNIVKYWALLILIVLPLYVVIPVKWLMDRVARASLTAETVDELEKPKT